MPHPSPLPEDSFDPRTPEEWADFRALSHRMVDDMLTQLEGLPDRKAWQEIPGEIRASLREPIPFTGIGPEAAYAHFTEWVLPYPNGNWHPRFFGWVQGQGTPLAMMADMLASGLNPHLAGFNHAPPLVEQQVVDWCAQLLGFSGASGLLVSGGTMANTLCLAVARFSKGRETGRDTRGNGMQQWPGDHDRAPMVLYASSETHGWIRKAVEWLGLGHRAVRVVPVGSDYRIDLQLLAQMVAADRATGMMPFCVVGTAGTVNTGATDDLDALASFCEAEQLWFHVDGAFGALIHLSDSLRPIVRGLERADSLGFDLHKWGSMPYECACALIRDPAVHHAAFTSTASYLTPMTRGPSAGPLYFNERGLELTRGFKALKVWMSFKAEGISKFARIIEQNVAQAQYLADRINAHAELELLAPAPLNIVNYRFTAPRLSASALNTLNQELLTRLQERGIATPSSTMLDGRFAIRVANVNHRSRTADFDLLVDEVVNIGRELLPHYQTVSTPTVPRDTS